jgi:fatty-acyl-CoA synthase
MDVAGLRVLLAGHLARWCLPDEIRLVDSLPLGATGKVDKKVLRARLALEGADAGKISQAPFGEPSG